MESLRECPVCFEPYSSNCKPLISPCGHSLCEKCLLGILQKLPLCPLCNSELPPDRKSFIINYSLIPSSSPRQLKKPITSLNHDPLIKKLQKEIKFHEELSKTLDTVLTDMNRSWEKSQSEIQDFTNFWMNTLEATRNSLINENNKFKILNEEKVIKKQREILAIVDKRKKILISVIESQRRAVEIDPEVNLELSSLDKITSYQIELVKNQFNSKLFQLNHVVFNESLKCFKQKMQKFEFDFQIEKDQNNSPSAIERPVNNVPLKNKELVSSSNHDKRREQGNQNDFIQEINERPAVHQQVRHARPDVPVKNPRDNQIKANFDYSDPNISLTWSIQNGPGETLLPEYAIGQIERLRKTNKKQIRIFREGSAKFLADLTIMEYHKLDARGFIIPGQSFQLISRCL